MSIEFQLRRRRESNSILTVWLGYRSSRIGVVRPETRLISSPCVLLVTAKSDSTRTKSVPIQVVRLDWLAEDPLDEQVICAQDQFSIATTIGWDTHDRIVEVGEHTRRVC